MGSLFHRLNPLQLLRPPAPVQPIQPSNPGLQRILQALENLSNQNSAISFSTIVLMIGGTVTTIVGCVYVLTHPSFYEGIKAVVDSFVKGITAVVDSFVKGLVIVLNFLPEWARPLSLSVFAASCVDRKFPVVITNGIGRSVYDGSIETANILRYAAVSPS